MKKLFTGTVLLVAFSLFSFSWPVKELPIGAPIPDPELRMKDITGNDVSFKDAKKEGGLLVMFSCNTCPIVRRNQERTKEICSEALAKNIGVILLNANEGSRSDGDSFEDMQSYAKDQQYKWHYVMDKNSVMADAFGAMRTPECFLFNKDLTLVYHGAIDNNPGSEANVSKKYLSDAINEMLAGKEVTVKVTRSIGCSIKRN